MERILNFEKMLRIMFTILFLLFAFLQWNDPDAVLWIVYYCMAAVISIGAISNLKYSFIVLANPRSKSKTTPSTSKKQQYMELLMFKRLN